MKTTSWRDQPSRSSDADAWPCSEHHTPRLPITSRVWFFPALILLMPLLSRACLVGISSKPRPAAPSNDQVCLAQYEQCIALCSDVVTDCGQICVDEFELCLKYGAVSSDSSASEPADWSCESSSEDDYDDSSSDWSCDYESSDDYSDDYSDEGGGFDCSADNYDEGDSDSDGEGDWGEDWGERSPAGGDGVHSPAELPG